MCFACKKNSNQVRILDAVKEARSVKVCEGCARIEGVILIRKPSVSQLQGANKTTSVYSRLQRLAGLNQGGNTTSTMASKPVLDEQRVLNNEFSELSIKKRQEIMQKLKSPVILVDHANWIIQKERRNRRLTTKQLADGAGVSEAEIKLIELGKIPTNAREIAEKIEQFFQIRIIKDSLRTPGFNQKVTYKSANNYDFTRPTPREEKSIPSAEVLVERTPSEKDDKAFVAKPLPTTKTVMNQEQGKVISRPPITGANYQSPLNTRSINANKPGVPRTSTPNPSGAKLGLSLAADAMKTQASIGQVRPVASQYNLTNNQQNKPSYAVPNPSRVMGGQGGKPMLSLAADAMKNAQNNPRVQDAKRLQVSRDNMDELTISQLQEIKKQREEAMKEKENLADQIEFIDLD